MDTREWTDGVLTYAARQVVKEPKEIHSWIICDGDIDPEWIESLNSVLDDNRLLTMPSGERIQFGPNVNFLFESHDLSCASPATITRMGMIFLRYSLETCIILTTHFIVPQKKPGKLQVRLLLEELLLHFFHAVVPGCANSLYVDYPTYPNIYDVLANMSQHSFHDLFCPNLRKYYSRSIRRATTAKTVNYTLGLINKLKI